MKNFNIKFNIEKLYAKNLNEEMITKHIDTVKKNNNPVNPVSNLAVLKSIINNTDKALNFLYEKYDLFDNIYQQQFYETESGFITDDLIDDGVIDYVSEIELLEFVEKNSDKSVYIISKFYDGKVELTLYEDKSIAQNDFCELEEKLSQEFAKVVECEYEIHDIVDYILNSVNEVVENKDEYTCDNCECCDLVASFSVELMNGEKILYDDLFFENLVYLNEIDEKFLLEIFKYYGNVRHIEISFYCSDCLEYVC